MTSNNKLKILLIAGEASGDEHASLVVRALKEKYGEDGVDIFGMGGDRLREAGMNVLLDIQKYAAVMGLTEVIKKFRIISKAYKTLLKIAKERQPDLVVLVDYPGFNLRIAQDFKKQGFKILYFISPQVWAWKKGRVKTMRKNLDAVATIFPFEEKFLRDCGVNARFVGHPFCDREEIQFDRGQFLKSVGLLKSKKTIVILPGSRKDEIQKLLVPMFKAYLELRAKRKDIQAIIPIANTIDTDLVYEKLVADEEIWKVVSKKLDKHKSVDFVRDAEAAFVSSEQVNLALRAADVGLIKSGTITMEALFSFLPFLVVYKVNSLTYYIGRKVVTGIKNFAMPNIIAGREIVTELLQEQVTPERMAKEIKNLLDNRTQREKLVTDLKIVRGQLSSASIDELATWKGEKPKTMANNVVEMIGELVQN